MKVEVCEPNARWEKYCALEKRWRERTAQIAQHEREIESVRIQKMAIEAEFFLLQGEFYDEDG